MEQHLEDRKAIPPLIIGEPITAKVHQLKSIQLLRGVAALAVMAYHLSLYAEQRYKVPFAGGIFAKGYLGVDLFFIISGFIITYTAFPIRKRNPPLSSYIRKRLVRIYPTYWALLFAFYLVCKVCYGGLPPADRSPFDWVAAFFLLPMHLPIIPVSWSLSHELYFYTLVALLLITKKLWPIPALVIVATLYTLFTKQSSEPILYFLFSPFNIEFLGGVGVYMIYRKDSLSPALSWIVLAVSMGWLFNSTVDITNNELSRLLAYGIPFIGIVIALVSLERRHKIRIPDVSIRLGDASYILYLLHPVALAILYRIAEVRPTLSYLTFLSMGVGVIVATMMASIIIHYYFEKPLIERLNTTTLLRQYTTASASPRERYSTE
jgi:peptidoglycan/LPS O-acetylase OafA/YrhL